MASLTLTAREEGAAVASMSQMVSEASSHSVSNLPAQTYTVWLQSPRDLKRYARPCLVCAAGGQLSLSAEECGTNVPFFRRSEIGCLLS